MKTLHMKRQSASIRHIWKRYGEADGTRYLEAALTREPKSAQDYCDRGRVYYYMEDYENAQKEFERLLGKRRAQRR